MLLLSQCLLRRDDKQRISVMKQAKVSVMMILILAASTVATGDVNITIDSSKHGQIRVAAKEFRYSQSPRVLATAQSANQVAAGGRVNVRRLNEPVVIVRYSDSASPFLVRAAAQGELLPSVLFEFVRVSGTGRPEMYQTVRLANAIVSSVKTIDSVDR